MKDIRSLMIRSSSLALACFAAAPALAQSAAPVVPPEAAADTDPSRDIVVTGLRRTATAQDTAAAINVLSSEQLDKTGVQGTATLQFQTPGLLVSQDLGLQTQVYIRGIGSNLQGIATANSVSTYLDGVYLPNTTQTNQSFSDIERIEVLKGPQATLYGRNATGGAINIVTQDPANRMEGKADIAYGNYNDLNIRGSISGPIVKDVLLARISAQYENRDGYYRNLFTGNRIANLRIAGIRAAFKILAADNLDIILRGDYTYTESGDFLKLRPATSVYYAGNPQYYTDDPRAVYYDIEPEQPAKDYGVSATIHWTTPIGKLTSITSDRIYDVGPIYYDSDQVPRPGTYFPNGVGAIGSYVRSDSIYHETYLSTDEKRPLSAIIGGTYFYESARELKRILGPSLAVPRTYTDRFGTTDAYSFYVDAKLNLGQFSIVGGVRYTSEKKTYDFYRVDPVAAPTFNSRRDSKWSPRVGVEFRPNADWLIYATATSGFKSGGFNTDVPTNSFGPESIWSYEGGFKSQLFDRRVRFNVSGFYYDYKDIQVLQYLTINSVISPIITNAGSAKLYGVDATLDVKATSNFTVGGGLSYLHSEFGSAVFCDPLRGSCTATDPAARPFFNVQGNRLTRAPEISANVYADYKIPLASGDVTLHGDGSYRSRTYYTVFQNPIYSAAGFWLLGANVRYTAHSGWFVEAYGQNLTDTLAITQIINSSPLRNPATGAILYGTPAEFDRYSPPRTYGIRIGTKF
ncbi:TonB-dependent receptor [Sphingomonas immobilis]|uniref:TonB-dependent receptor n=1 Tax=Sphingomonas immobilis TaxID=3063997 RepID=A0ABT8ZZ87_9SPHN|nr:TonB-dependent receptor [Sphingomonas sp. CA1-15]MDO7842300.1 TonB-dependent receptor [Sphingomonas sp. CA1-15]